MSTELKPVAIRPVAATPDEGRFQRISRKILDVKTWLTEAPPWAVSLAIHAVALGALAGVSATVHTQPRTVIVETRLEPDDIVQPEFSQTLNVLSADSPPSETISMSITQPGTSVGRDLGTPSFHGGTAAGNSFGSGKGTPGPMAALDSRRRGPTLAGPGGVGLSTGAKLDMTVAVAGGTDVSAGAGGVGGAIDRITYEIARSLDDRKTLVIWLLDATASLKAQREELAARIDRVYKELGVLDKDKHRALLTAVVGFGEKSTVLTADPTDSVETVKKAIRSVKDDESGTENVFSAINDSLNRWGKPAITDRRNILVVVMTDEKGDDEAKLEEVIVKAKTTYRAKVYVAGAAAPLGRPQVMLPWPSASQVVGYAPADRGPESVRIERDYLPFWRGGGRMDNISSGFGPWALTRLCRETGGIYFIMQDTANTNYDPSTLRAYEPDYVPRKEYDRLLASSLVRKAIIGAADLTSRGPKDIPNIPTEFPGDDAGLNRAMGDGQAIMAKLQYFIVEPLKTMSAAEKDRDKEPSRRWRAEFDLLYGRLLANKVRTFTYNAMCAQMKKKKRDFENSESNRWRLEPDSDVPTDTLAGPKLAEAAEKARLLLNRVVEENPGTPWAEFAKRELQTDLGFQWKEFHQPTASEMARATPKTKPATPKPAAPPPAVPKKI